MKEKLIGKKIRVAVAFVTASKMNLANITKYYDGIVIDIDNNFIELDCGFVNINYVQTIEILND
ncbi:MAG: hypothetical protein J6C28_05325 [Bacilli bacterium]|nr:hypothetical protein [Bacilli bacterium]